MNAEAVRAHSIEIAAKAGLQIPNTLPLSVYGLLRAQSEVADRMLCLNALAASAYGFQRGASLRWLDENSAGGALTFNERAFLQEGRGDPAVFKMQVEGLWLLAWASSLEAELDFWKDCDGNFVQRLPDLKRNQSGSGFRQQVQLRSADQIGQAEDLAFCLHWAVRQAQLDGALLPGAPTNWMLMERRKALVWLTGDLDWDEVQLDT